MEVFWWHWLVLGLLLVVGELATPGGFYVVFFGLAAIVVGLLAAAGEAAPENVLLGWLTPLSMQLLLFSVLSVVSLLLFRARLLSWMQLTPQAPPVDALVGEIGTVSELLEPGAVGKVELRGTSWSARNTSEAALAFGARCRVLAVQGLMLHVGPEGGR